MVQAALEAKSRSITAELMSLPVSSTLTNVCHAAVHYDHPSRRFVTVRLRPLLCLRTSQ